MFKSIQEIIRFRELLCRLAWLDFKLKYKNPFLGILWAVIIPFLTIVVYWWLFSVLMNTSIQQYPFFIYMMTAIFPWMFAQGAILSASTSIIDRGALIKEVNIPREIIPLSIVISHALSFFINLLVLLSVLLACGMGFSRLIVFLPLVILLHVILVSGLSLIFSVLHVRYRDIRYIVEVLLMVIFFLTPAIYSMELLNKFSPVYIKLYLLNPFVGITNLYRLCFLRGFSSMLPQAADSFNLIFMPIAAAGIIVYLGFRMFHDKKNEFSDFI